MPARASGHGNQAIGTFFDGFAGVFVVDDIVQHHATVAVRCGVDVFACAQAGDDDGHLVLHAQGHVVLQPVVAFVDDLVDGKRGGGRLGVGGIVRSQALRNFNQPVFQLCSGAGVECGHGADHARNALGNHQLGVADDEQR